MGFTNFNKLSVVNGLAVGKHGQEKMVMDGAGRMVLAFNPGNQFFVDSGVGSYLYDGATWDKPFATLDYAVGKCTANNGDIIWVAPGHNEGITAAAAIDIDIAGVSIIGLGNGSLKPTIDFDHGDATVAVGANDVYIENIRFRTSANAVGKGLDIEAGMDNCQVINCDFGFAETATDEFAISITNNAGCDNTLIKGCYFQAGVQAAVVGVKLVGASDNVQVIDNRFVGAFSTAAINGITTLSTNCLIQGNIIQQGATEPGIELLTGTTGVIADNYIATNLGTIVASVVADGCWKFQNFYCEVGDETGVLIGTASAND